MSATGAFRALDKGSFEQLEDVEQERTTREEGQEGGDPVEHDEYGNPVRVAATGADKARVLARLLNDGSFEFRPEEEFGSFRGLKHNPLGLARGFDPYDTGILPKKERKKRKNLRALSTWIQQKKRFESSQ
jgi:hypothetical protein